MSSTFDPFDPLGLFPRRARAAKRTGFDAKPENWLGQWMTATRRWADPRWWLEQGAGALTPEAVMLWLVEGLAGRFTGRELLIRAKGHDVRGVLDHVHLDGDQLLAAVPRLPGLPHRDVELRVSGHAIELDGLRLEEVSIVAHHVELQPGVPASVSAGPIDLVLSATESSVATWLERSVANGWSLAAGGGGRIVAHHQAREIELVVEPRLRGVQVEVELRSLAWRSIRLRIPRWLRLARRQALPSPPGQLELVEAWQTDGRVNVRLRIAHHVEHLRLDRARDAVLRDDPTLVLGVN